MIKVAVTIMIRLYFNKIDFQLKSIISRTYQSHHVSGE